MESIGKGNKEETIATFNIDHCNCFRYFLSNGQGQIIKKVWLHCNKHCLPSSSFIRSSSIRSLRV